MVKYYTLIEFFLIVTFLQFSVLFNINTDKPVTEEIQIKSLFKKGLNFSKIDPNLWSLEVSGINEVQKITNGSKDVIIAIIDSGVDYRYPELNKSLWRNPGEIPDNNIDDDGNGYLDDVIGWNFIDNNNDPLDGYGHGTFISSQIIGLQESSTEIEIPGLAPNISLMHLKWIDNTNKGGSVDEFVAAVTYAVEMGAKIISLSLFWRGIDSKAILALEWAYSKGVVIVGVTGNNADLYKGYIDDLGALDQVIATGAINQDLEKANFSQYGNEIELVAPGEYIYGASLLDKSQNGSLVINKTSFIVETFEFSNVTFGEIIGELVYTNLGKPEDFLDINVTNKIALIDRGESFFFEKVNNASINGAVGVIISNDRLGLIFGTLDSPSNLPVLGISNTDGETLKVILSSNQTLIANINIESSNITLLSGTSFAVPYITSTAALILSLNPELKNYELRTLLDRTATDLNATGVDIFTGYGLINASFALEASYDNLVPSLIIDTTYDKTKNQLIILIDGSDDIGIYSILVRISSNEQEIGLREFVYQGKKAPTVVEIINLLNINGEPLKIQVSLEDISGKTVNIEKNLVNYTGFTETSIPPSTNTSFSLFILIPITLVLIVIFRKRE